MRGYCQNLEPLDLAKKIFDENSMPDLEKFTTGEYKGRPNGRDLQKHSMAKFLLLNQTDKRAVVSMTISDSTGKVFDTYLHFQKDTIWKMNAFRALAMTGIIEQVKKELEKLTPLQVDEIVKSAAKSKKGRSPLFTSKEDYEFELGNATLTLESDAKIIEHFRKNKKAFERIKDSAINELRIKKTGEERAMDVGENLKTDYRKLYISSVTTGGYEFGNCLNFLIGGILDNSVGYIYVGDEKNLPEMNPNSIIMLREIGDGWYVYKTT